MNYLENHKNLFWDVSIAEIDIEKHSKFIIERTLEHGNSKAVNDLFDIYSNNWIIEAVKTSRSISSKTGYFWKHRLNINEPIKCLQMQSQNQLSKRWS